MGKQWPLTAHRGAVPEDLCDLWIHLNVEVLVLGDLEVPCADLLLYPVIELLADNGAGYVDDELLRQPPQLLLVRKVYMALRMLFDEVSDLPYSKAFILGHEGVFEMLAFHDYKTSATKDMDLHFFLPASRSLRKYTLIWVYSGR